MSGIYLHVPFCRKACHYCDFHFSTSFKTYRAVVDAMNAELLYWSEAWPAPIQTIYLGGGTPSVLEESDLRTLLDTLKTHYKVESGAEVTLEANPEDISSVKLHEWRRLGVNRLSMGVQSFFDDELEWMNRNHKAEKSMSSIKMAQDAGFENITIDLIYGVPVSNDERWARNVNLALESGVPHISAYALTVEPKTALAFDVLKGRVESPSEEDSHRQFMYLRKTLIDAGFVPYEISNFGKPGWHSKHNSNYWNGVPYLGIGPGAHSFDGEVRRWSVSNNARYTKSVANRETWFEDEHLSTKDRYNEWVMTGLRRNVGISLEEVKVRFGDDFYSSLHEGSKPHLLSGKLKWEGDRLVLTEEGLFLADGIASDLFVL